MTLEEKKKEIVNKLLEEYHFDNDEDIWNDIEINFFNSYDKENIKEIIELCGGSNNLKYYHHKAPRLRFGGCGIINEDNMSKLSFDEYIIMTDIIYNVINATYKDNVVGIMIRSKKYNTGYVLFESGLSLYIFINHMMNVYIDKLYHKIYKYLKNLYEDTINTNQGVFNYPEKYSEEILNTIFEEYLKNECYIIIFRDVIDGICKEYIDLLFKVNSLFSIPFRWIRKLYMFEPYKYKLKYLFGWSLTNNMNDYNAIMRIYKQRIKILSNKLGYN